QRPKGTQAGIRINPNKARHGRIEDRLMTATGGICAFVHWTPEQQAEADRRLEEQRKRDAAADEYAARCQDIYDKLEAMLAQYLRDEAQAVNAKARITPADRKIFEQFKEYLAQWDPPLPPLPAHPAAAAAFAVNGLGHSTAKFTKRLCALSRVH